MQCHASLTDQWQQSGNDQASDHRQDWFIDPHRRWPVATMRPLVAGAVDGGRMELLVAGITHGHGVMDPWWPAAGGRLVNGRWLAGQWSGIRGCTADRLHGRHSSVIGDGGDRMGTAESDSMLFLFHNN